MTRVAPEIGWPHTAFPAEKGGDDRLVERGVPPDQPPVAGRKGADVGRHGFGIFGAGEFAAQPEWAAVVHQVDDRDDAQLFDHVGDDGVGPAPVELPLERLHPIPGHTPAHGPDAQLAGQSQILPPVLVVPHQLILVERPVPGPRLGNEGVLDPAGPEEILRPAAQQRLGHCAPSRTSSAAFVPAMNA